VVREFLSERDVPYVLRDVVRDPEALAEFLALGAPLPPVVAYNGRWVAGYDPERLDELLGDVTI
jgi:hypothetical protein